VPAPLAALVLACLERDPARRPSLDVVEAGLQALVDALPAPRISRFRPGAARRLREMGAA